MPQFLGKPRGCGFFMSKNNSGQKEKPLVGISLKMACGSKMALFLSAVTGKVE